MNAKKMTRLAGFLAAAALAIPAVSYAKGASLQNNAGNALGALNQGLYGGSQEEMSAQGLKAEEALVGLPSFKRPEMGVYAEMEAPGVEAKEAVVEEGVRKGLKTASVPAPSSGKVAPGPKARAWGMFLGEMAGVGVTLASLLVFGGPVTALVGAALGAYLFGLVARDIQEPAKWKTGVLTVFGAMIGAFMPVVPIAAAGGAYLGQKIAGWLQKRWS